MKQRLLRRPEVEARTGVSKSEIYRRIQENTFPAPINLGPRSVGWLETDIDSWIDDLISDSRGAA